ncbi:MAG: leucine-rich repeat protein [Oscillospiraceae bacterium]|nr:leucine-rich repeat protein [Oscillospiraceae bacterium]
MKYTKLTALASALCTAFSCTSASFTAFGIDNELPENTFVYEDMLMQIAFERPSGKPYLVVKGFTKDTMQEGCYPPSLHLPFIVETCSMPPFEGMEEYEALEVREIGDGAFSDCKRLMDITIPYTVKEIGMRAFENCANLTDVRFDYNMDDEPQLYKIDSYAFNNCRKLENISLPSSLDMIEEGAFSRCDALTEIKIPAQFIERYAFTSCINLADVIITRSYAEIGENAFFNDAVTDPLWPGETLNYLFYGTIHGYHGSTAQEYAEKFKCNFEYLSYLDKDAGDLDGDSKVTVADAQLALREYTTATVAGGKSTLTFAQRKNGDINRDGAVGVEDAQLILKYYVTNTLAGTPASWEDLLYGKVEVEAPEKPVTTPAVTTTTAPAVTTSTMPATSAAPVQTTSAPAVTTAPASTALPVMTTAPAATSVPVMTTAAVQTTAAK